MKKTFGKFGKCVSACLITTLTLSVAVPVFAWDDDAWDDFDVSAPIDAPPAAEFEPVPPPPVYTEPAPEYSTPAPTYEQQPTWGSTEPVYTPEPAYTPEPVYAQDPAPADVPIGTADLEALFARGPDVVAESEGFIRVIRHERHGISDFQNAVIEGLQVSVEPGADDEITVTCYFIFRDRPKSFFYDINRKDKKLVFEFLDARTGSAPVASIQQSPIEEIVIEEMQMDANRDIKGLTPEWHDLIRISFQLEHLPVISVSNEHNIISFSYKWTTDSEKIPQYLEPNRFPMVFWISGGTLGSIGIGVLTWFLIPKKDKTPSNVLSTNDLPNRTRGSSR